MKKYRFAYYVKEGVNSIFTHGFMSFASVCIIVACLLIMGSFSLLALNVNSILSEFESENVILAYIDEDLSEMDSRKLESEIERLNNVDHADFISREQAYKAFIGKYEDQSRFENIDSSVFRHRYAVYVNDVGLIPQTQQDLADVYGIAKVNANLTVARGFVLVRNIVTGVSLVLVAILLVVSLFIMSNTIKLATFERREEIAIMRMVGATNRFIRWPFVYEGFLLGMCGSLVAYLAMWGIYEFITDRLIGGQNVTFFSTLPFSETAIPLIIIFAGVGFAVGVIGSVVAIRKYLKV